MSCYIMNHDNIREIGYTLAEILNRSLYDNEVTIASSAAQCSNLGKALTDCYVGDRFSGERISEILHRINAQAYAERYRESDLELFSAPESRRKYSIWKLPERDGIDEIPQDWHYALTVFIDCWLYQTDEGNAAIADKRLAVQEFVRQLTRQIVQHSDGYRKARSSF